MRLGTRIAVAAAGVVTIAVILVSAAAYVSAGWELRGVVDRDLTQQALAAQRFASDPTSLVGDDSASPSVASVLEGYGEVIDSAYLYQIVAPDGEVAAPEGQPELPTPDPSREIGPSPVFSDGQVGGRHFRIITFRSVPGDTVQIAHSLAEVDATLARLARAVLFFGIVGVLLAVGTGALIARGVLRSITRLTEAVNRVGETKDFSERIEVHADDELGRLARHFNDMLAALENSRRRQRRLVRDVGHEFRTPLTALRTNIELLGKMGDPPSEKRAELITAIDAEIRELTGLVREVFDLVTDRYSEGPIDEVMLDEIVEGSVERTTRRTKVPFEVRSKPSSVRGHPVALARAVDNLLDNAAKWSPEGESVTVTVGNGSVTVRDRGPGIADEDMDRIFDRFYRSPVARSMPGSGLGLSIVDQIVGEHGGRVFASNAPDGGAIVGFELPVEGITDDGSGIGR